MIENAKELLDNMPSSEDVPIDEKFREIDDMVRADPLEMLRKISRFEEPTNGWSIPFVAYALRSVYDALTASREGNYIDPKDELVEQMIMEEEDEVDSDTFDGFTDPS